MTANGKSRRRWFQYNLRTLLVLMLVICIGMGWLAVKMQRARKETAAVKALVGLGGWVSWNDPHSPSRSPAWLRDLLGDGFFTHPYSAVGGGDSLELSERIHPAPRVGCLRELRTSAYQLEHLQGLTQLRVLDLARSQVGDSGLEHLWGLTATWTLSLYSTQVTDAGLKHLKGLSQLRELSLEHTHVSDDGVRGTAAGMPTCHILR